MRLLSRFVWPAATQQGAADRVLVHEWFTSLGGSDKVAAEISRTSDIDVVYCFALNHSLVERLDLGAEVVTWRWGEWAARTRWFKFLLPLMPLVWACLPLDRATLVVTSAHSCANSVRSPWARRVSYCHTPMRYAWECDLERGRVGPLLRPALPVVARVLRRFDRLWSLRVDTFVANSAFVADRIERCYQRPAIVVPPPIDIAGWGSVPRCVTPVDDRRRPFLAAGRLVSYKRIDLAIDVANATGTDLVVAGAGPDLERLRERAGSTVSFVVAPSDAELRALLDGAEALLFPGVEDFGMLPVEAQARGLPIIARTVGGARDTVIDGVTGVLIDGDDVQDWADAVSSFNRSCFDEARIRCHARTFDAVEFRARFAEVLAGELGERAPTASGTDTVISVVIPARNEAHRIGRAIQSVVDQGRFGPDVEIVVVDDGSTDRTAEIAARYPHTTVVHTEGVGITAALNLGLANAAGGIIVRLDADDWFVSGALENLTRPLIDRPDLGLVALGAREVDVSGRWLGDVRPPIDERHLAFVNAAECAVTHSAIAYRRDQVLDLGGYAACGAAEDFQLWVRLVNAGVRMVGDPAIACVRVIHGNSISVKRAQLQKDTARASREAALDALEHPLPETAADLLAELRRPGADALALSDLQFRTLRLARQLWAGGRRGVGTALVWQAARVGPVSLLVGTARGANRRRRNQRARTERSDQPVERGTDQRTMDAARDVTMEVTDRELAKCLIA